MADYGRFEYDVALSFAGEDREVAEKLAGLLRARNLSVLFDEFKPAEPASKDPVLHIAEIYRTKAWYCVMFLSQHYPLKKWTQEERISAQEHALRDANEYILPVRLDNTEVSGLVEKAGYMGLRTSSMEELVNLLDQKMRETKGRSGPPAKSHDLRSGNVPSNREKPDAR